MKTRFVLLIVALAALATLGIVAGSNEVKKLSTYGWAARSGDVSLIADCDAARLRGGEKYIPVLIWLGHDGKGTIYADRTSFTLTDPKGAKYTLPSAEEVRSGYGPNLIGSDYDYYGKTDYGDTRYVACAEIHKVAFFPNPSGAPGILYDKVELPSRTFCMTLLYFPNPAGAVPGEYKLTYDDSKSKTHMEVPFTVPWQESKKK
jgi:hypothetical protein